MFKKKQEPSIVVNVKNQEKEDIKNPNNLSFQVRESYKAARTNIVYSIIKKGCKKIVITSPNKGEGKSSTAFNLASVLAQEVDVRVLLVECDLRRPHVHSNLNVSHSPGITNYLNNENDYVEDIIKETHIENLKAICYGDAIPPNPSELLASPAMAALIEKLETMFDYIIFDTPPVGIVIDAIPIIKNSDGVVVVVKNDSTTYPQFDKTMEILKRSDSKILGVIVNCVDSIKSKKYRNYKYGYGGYGYYGY